MHNPLESLVQNALGVINHQNNTDPAVSQAQYGKALLQKKPSQVMPLDSPHSDIFGGRYTYHRYSDPADQERIKGFETTIGNLKNTMPLIAGGALLAGQLLSPIRKMLSFVPGVSTLLNPLTLAGGAGLFSALQLMSKRQEMSNYLSDRMRNIQGADDGFSRDMSALDMSTVDQVTGIKQGFSSLNHSNIKDILERLDDISRREGREISNVPAKMYAPQNGTHLYGEAPHADYYRYVALPAHADDNNITPEQVTYVRNNGTMNGRLMSIPENMTRRKALFMKDIIQRTGLKELSSSSDADYVSKNKQIYGHALNIFKAKHSAVNTLLETVTKDIRSASNALRQELARRPASMIGMRNMYISGVIRKIKNEVSPHFSNHPDLLNIVDSLLFKEWDNIKSEYKNRTY